MIFHLHRGEVVLFLAEESLLYQVATWMRAERRFSLRLVSSRDPLVMGRALDDAAVAIIDATREPGEAMAILEQGIRYLGPQRLAVYSEQMHQGLELFVRVRGVVLLAGPMTPAEWQGVFEPLTTTVLPMAGNQ
jgi:hypothetical protein